MKWMQSFLPEAPAYRSRSLVRFWRLAGHGFPLKSKFKFSLYLLPPPRTTHPSPNPTAYHHTRVRKTSLQLLPVHWPEKLQK